MTTESPYSILFEREPWTPFVAPHPRALLTPISVPVQLAHPDWMAIWKSATLASNFAVEWETSESPSLDDLLTVEDKSTAVHILERVEHWRTSPSSIERLTAHIGPVVALHFHRFKKYGHPIDVFFSALAFVATETAPIVCGFLSEEPNRTQSLKWLRRRISRRIRQSVD